MIRYLHVLGLFWLTSIIAEMEYRTNFALAAVVSLGHIAGSVFALYLLYRQGYEPGGWPFTHALLVIAFFTLMEGFTNTFLRRNLNRIVSHVREGTLDYILLKPVDSQFWLSTRNLSTWGVPNLVYGLLLVGWVGQAEGFGPTAYLAGIVPMLLALVVLYGLWFILATTSLWFVKIENVTHVLHNLLSAGRYPVPAYPEMLQFIFKFVVPVAFMTTAPAEVMLGRDPWFWTLTAAAISVVLVLLSRAWWKFALRFYTSASS